MEVALIGYRGVNTGRKTGGTGKWDKSGCTLGAGRREVELSAGAEVVNAADDEKTTGALDDTTVGTTAGVGTIAGAGGCEAALNAVTDETAIAGGGTDTGALVDTTGGATAGASERSRSADKSTGGGSALVVTGVGIRGLDSSVNSVTRGSNTGERLNGPDKASAKSGELLPEGVGSSPRIVVSSSPSDSLTRSRVESRGLSRKNGGSSELLNLRMGL